MSIASLALLLAANTVPQPVVTTASTAHSLGRWNPGPVRCGETVVAPVRLSAVQPWLRWGPGEPTTVTLQFRIDSDGRPLSIRAEGTSFVPNSDDIAPALAASTFAPGTPRTDCRIDYRQQVVPLAQADPADLIAYSLAPTSGPLRPEGWERDPSGGYRLPASAATGGVAARLSRLPQASRYAGRTAMVDDQLRP
ncbi:hypothetical protein ACVOMT_04250 [Sphingomonas panni]